LEVRELEDKNAESLGLKTLRNSAISAISALNRLWDL